MRIKTYSMKILKVLLLVIIITNQTLSQGQSLETGFRKLDTYQNTYFDVLYFFWYGSPNSLELTTSLDEWKKKNPAIKLQAIPLTFKEDFIPHSQIFFVLDEIGRGDLNLKAILAIHTQGKRLLTDTEIGTWAENQGLNKDDFLFRLRSEAVANKVNQAAALGKRYSISGVPSFVIDGQFLTNLNPLNFGFLLPYIN